MNFTADDVQMTARVRIDLAHFFTQQFQMHDDCVDRVFYLVRDSGGEATDGSQPAGEFDLVFNAAEGLGGAHGQKRANALARLGDEVACDLNAASILKFYFPLRYRSMQRESIEYDPAEHGRVGKYVFDILLRS